MKLELGKVYSNPYARAFKPQQVVEVDGDHEVGMAQGQLDYVIKSATELKGKLGNGEKNLPGWIQDHISKAHSYLHQANSGYHELGETKSVNEATALQKIFRKIGWGGDGWTPKDYARQIKDLPDSTLKIWYDSAKKNKGIPNTPLEFQQKLTKIEMEKRGLLETLKSKEMGNLGEMTASQVAKKFKVGQTVKFKAGGRMQTDKISNVDGIYLYLKGGGSIPYQSVLDESVKLNESKITKTYNFKNVSLTRFDEIDASFIRAGIKSNPDFNKKSITVSGDKNKIDKIVKFYKGIEESMLESTEEPKIITQLRDVMKSGYKKLKDPKTGRTMTVDSYSASAIVKVYDALKDPKNKEKFSSAGLLGMQNMAFKLIK
jgi:hypothetical protein